MRGGREFPDPRPAALPAWSGHHVARRVPEFAIDRQLNAAQGQQGKPSFGPSRPHEAADPELPIQIPGVSNLVGRDNGSGTRRFHLFNNVFCRQPAPGPVGGKSLISAN